MDAAVLLLSLRRRGIKVTPVDGQWLDVAGPLTDEDRQALRERKTELLLYLCPPPALPGEPVAVPDEVTAANDAPERFDRWLCWLLSGDLVPVELGEAVTYDEFDALADRPGVLFNGRGVAYFCAVMP